MRVDVKRVGAVEPWSAVKGRQGEFRVATLAAAIGKTSERKTSNRLAYYALLTFTFFYYARPEDLIPGLSVIPVEKIIGGVALIALIITLASGQVKRKLPLELKLLILLFAHLVIS